MILIKGKEIIAHTKRSQNLFILDQAVSRKVIVPKKEKN